MTRKKLVYMLLLFGAVGVQPVGVGVPNCYPGPGRGMVKTESKLASRWQTKRKGEAVYLLLSLTATSLVHTQVLV